MTRWERRERKKRKEKNRMPVHGKSLFDILRVKGERAKGKRKRRRKKRRKKK